MLENKDYFAIKDKNKRIIFYFPLKKMAFKCNEKAKVLIDDYFLGKEIPRKFNKIKENLQKIENKDNYQLKNSIDFSSNHVVILLSEMCNLNCTYCYAQNARSKDYLNKSQLKIIIDSVLSTNINSLKEFTFLGGGEPLVTWNLLKWSVDYIISQSNLQKVKIGIATNMTLLDEEKIAYFKENNIVISSSFDILPKIQNSQRQFAIKKGNTFLVVDKNIKKLITNGVIPRIRSTITKDNVKLMPKMINFASNNYPEIKYIHFEHVSSSYNDIGYYNKFIKYFFKARKIARKKGIKLSNSIIKSIYSLNSRFCRGEFCVTPTGDLVACHRLSSKREELFKNVVYGNVDNKKINIDKKQKEEVNRWIDKISENCQTCFAKYHCAGACPYNRYSFTRKQFEDYCSFTRKMIIKYLDIIIK